MCLAGYLAFRARPGQVWSVLSLLKLKITYNIMKEARTQPGRFSAIRLVIGIVSVFVAIGLARSITDHWHKRTIVTERQEALKREEERNRLLISKLQEATSSAFIEKEAREKLGLVKEGDTIVLLDKAQTSELHAQEDRDRSLPNWKKWWNLFF
jgi:cell division protein FtsB